MFACYIHIHHFFFLNIFFLFFLKKNLITLECHQMIHFHRQPRELGNLCDSCSNNPFNHSGDFHDHSYFKTQRQSFFFFHCTAVITRFLYDCLFHFCCPQTAPGNYIKYFCVDLSSHIPLKPARGHCWNTKSMQVIFSLFCWMRMSVNYINPLFVCVCL